MFGHKGALEIPPAAKQDHKAVEIARIWAAGGSQQVALRTKLWDDPAAWGILLADLARHVARAYQQASGNDPAETMARIREGLSAELDSPSDTPTGGLV